MSYIKRVRRHSICVLGLAVFSTGCGNGDPSIGEKVLGTNPGRTDKVSDDTLDNKTGDAHNDDETGRLFCGANPGKSGDIHCLMVNLPPNFPPQIAVNDGQLGKLHPSASRSNVPSPPTGTTRNHTRTPAASVHKDGKRGGPLLLGSGLDRAHIDEVVRSHLNTIQGCYTHALTKEPTLTGWFTVKFFIDNDGSVMAANKMHTTMNHAGVEHCVVNVVKQMKFGKPKGGGLFAVTYPFIFTSD